MGATMPQPATLEMHKLNQTNATVPEGTRAALFAVFDDRR